MGILFNRVQKILGYSDTAGFTGGGFGSGVALASPFSSGYALAPVIAKDLGLPYGAAVSALDAYKVPSISKGLALLTGTAANCEFVEADGTPVAGWLNNTPDAVTPGMRLAALLADLVLHREAVWFVSRDGAGNIDGAMHLPVDTWTLSPAGQVLINGREVPAANVLYFQSFRPLGLLTFAAETIDHYLDLSRTIRTRGKNPIPMLELHVKEDADLTKAELDKALADWSAARQALNGATAFTPAGIELIAHSDVGGGSWLVEARNEVRLDTANFMNLPAALLEGASGSSGTYENTLQNKDEFVSLSLAEWVAPIEQRLSQPDALNRPVRLDVSKYTAADPARGTDARGNTGTAVAPDQREITE